MSQKISGEDEVNIPRQMVDLQRSEEFDILRIEVPSEVASKLFPDELLNLFRGAVARKTLRFPVQGCRQPYLPHALERKLFLGSMWDRYSCSKSISRINAP